LRSAIQYKHRAGTKSHILAIGNDQKYLIL